MTAKKRQTKAEKKAAEQEEAFKNELANRPPPGEETRAAIAHASEANKGRRRRVQVKASAVGETLQIGSPHSDEDGFTQQIENAFGSPSSAFQLRLLTDVQKVAGTAKPEEDTNVLLAVLDGLQPQNEIEAMLAAQMTATHAVTMHMLGKARHAEYLEHMNSFGGLATKLLRTFTAQTEALAKLRRGGEQTVRVEHVHVHSGGQAIVGNVNHAGGGGGLLGNQNQPHAKALSHAPQSPLWSEDSEREPVPVTGDAER